MRLVAFAVLSLLLSSCGYYLAGTLPLPPALDRVYLTLERPYQVSEAPLEGVLRERLTQRGATVVSRPRQAETHLRMWDLAERRETLSIGPDGKALEYRLLLSVRYEVRQGETLLLPPDSLAVSRDYSFEPNSILAKEAEEAQLREFIQSEMAELLLLRMEVGLRTPPPAPPQVVPVPQKAAATR